MKIISQGINPIIMVVSVFGIMFLEGASLDFNLPEQILYAQYSNIINRAVFASILGYSLINFVIPSLLTFAIDHLIAEKEEQ